MNESYVLITAARNEEAYIHKAIDSVLAQTLLPKRWVIVSDGSTDQTDEIIKRAAAEKDFIIFFRKRSNIQDLGFASKVYALREGIEKIKDNDYEYIGHLDADVSFAPDYYRCVIERLVNNPKLGLTGGFIYEQNGTKFLSRPSNSTDSVAGAIQFFRRKCYENIGGFKPIYVGGEDWYAEIVARMKGWEVKSYPELKVFHHKKSAESRGFIKENIRQGVVDFSFGTHPLFEIAKVLRRVKEKPYVFAALVRLVGFLYSYLKIRKRVVSAELVVYLRNEQLRKLRAKII